MNQDVRLSFFGKDARSTVFARDGRILRAESDPNLAGSVLDAAGVRALMRDGLLVETWIAERQDAGVLLEHRRIAPFTYPGEWSFSMFRDAALTTLAVQDALSACGFMLKDAHAYNVGFDRGRPVFIDFASIGPPDPRYLQWRPGGEFRDAFLRILRIWSRTNRTTALSFVNAVWARSDDEALIFGGRAAFRFRSRVRRVLGKADIATAMSSVARRGALEISGYNAAKRLAARAGVGATLALQRVTGHPFSTARLRRETERIPLPVDATMWGNYQSNMALHDELTARFRRVVEIVGRLEARSVFEVAGNQGALAEALLAAGVVQSVTCSDQNEHAIDALYRRIRSTGRSGITPLVHDFMIPDPIRCNQPRDFTSDVVIALAVTHHLLLSQGFLLDAVIERMVSYGRRHLIIEFMPKGLWDGRSGPPVPSWYTVTWFAEGLARHGRVVLQEQLEENRIIFLVDLPAGRGSRESPKDTRS